MVRERPRFGPRLRPVQNVLVLRKDGLRLFPADEIEVALVGQKAWGVTCLPPSWTGPGLVIDGEAAANPQEPALLREGLERAGILDSRLVLIRSSGVAESIQERGRLESSPSPIVNLWRTLQELRQRSEYEANVHWLVQPFVETRIKGHLSNERRLTYERRDWIAEIESRPGRKGTAVSVAVRNWRDGRDFSDGPILCSSEAQISLALKNVAIWGMAMDHRVHFEWVWDGQRISIVQVDAEAAPSGIDPRDAIKVAIPTLDGGELEAFHTANPSDFSEYRKLKNARIYSSLGYAMPPFYVLKDSDLIRAIGSGNIPASVRADFRRLTARPLIIRTDGRDIPADRREMLPRSDELRSAAEAEQWIVDVITRRIPEASLAGYEIVFIAHHFIPSVAAAWARAEPGKPLVRIETLWGVPEGLYWYSHDVFQVDTQKPTITPAEAYGGQAFPFRKRLRHKRSFVAPDESGTFVHRTVRPPSDWASSVTKEAWLSEMAWTTRRVAETEGDAIALMWFVQNHAQATQHAVLPWYHEASRLQESPKAAPRTKYKSSADYRIETVEVNRPGIVGGSFP